MLLSIDSLFPLLISTKVYVPPYLATGLQQPTFDLPEDDWSYNGQYTVTNIHLFQGQMSGVRVSLIGGEFSWGFIGMISVLIHHSLASSSTHGNQMGARTIFPAVSCSGTTCTITAPPNAGICPPGWFMLFVMDGPTPSSARWVRIGGDPSQLGNWPNLPGFTLPGV